MKTIYVSTKSGSDLPPNDGSRDLPFKTIGQASSEASSRDTIYIAAGTYHETVIPQVDGVTYTGELGPNGELQTIIDPSTPTRGWEKDWNIGKGVWRLNLGYEPGILTYNGKCIECVGQSLMTLKNPSADDLAKFNLDKKFWPDLRIKHNQLVGLALLALENPTPGFSGATYMGNVNFWDVPFALAGYDPATQNTYIRFSDGTDPTNLPNHLTLNATPKIGINGKSPYGIDISGISGMRIKNLIIQGAYKGIRITVDQFNTGGNNNTVTNCHIRHGLSRIFMNGVTVPGFMGIHDNEISYNTFTLDMYGYQNPGAYPLDQTEPPANSNNDLARKEWFYSFLKYIVGDNSTADIAIQMRYCGANNRIHHNKFENGGEGVFTCLCDNTQIYSNTFQHLSDCGVLASDFLQAEFVKTPSGETVQGNTFSDVFQFIRYDRIDVADGVRTNFHYFLSNTGGNDPKLGDPNLGMIVQFHMQGPDPADPSRLSTADKFALTMAGNQFGPTGAVFHFSVHTAERKPKGIPSVSISGNAFISPQTIRWGGLWTGENSYSTFITDPTMVGSFMNNKLVDDMRDPVTHLQPAWYGIGNKKI
jgi:hypothetical protein